MSFKEDLKITENKEEARLLKIQRRFKNGEIDEEDIDDEDYDKLLTIYDKQNLKLREDIERYKQETETIIKRMRKE